MNITPTALIAVTTVALAGGYGAASQLEPQAASRSLQTLPAAVTPPAAAVAPSNLQTKAAPRTTKSPSRSQTTKPPSRSQTRQAPSAMNDAVFWRLMTETRRAAGNDTDRQSELLKERLTHLPGPSIVKFARIRHSFDKRAYTWDLWGAAYVIEDGCSDDCFRDFRGYVISLGRGPYEAALRNPDSLAGVAQDAETGNWENADNVAPDAYSSATGGDFPLDDSDLSGRPRGKPWSENNMTALARRYPRLYARFR
jgi:Protein of unknown function (DUF4240)